VEVGRWRWLLVASLLAQMVVTLGRGILGAFFTESYPTFLAPHPVNYAFAVIVNATTVLSLMAVLLAHRDEAARELERLATVDGLTGVLNRSAWMSRAATELAVSVRYGYPVAVLMIDLDHFKQINDTRGHADGDRALMFVARALEAAVRPGDLVGRYGGEEFCVLMNHAENAAANAFDVRLRGYSAPSPSASWASRSPTAPASPCASRPRIRSRRCCAAPTPGSTAPRRRAARARSRPARCGWRPPESPSLARGFAHRQLPSRPHEVAGVAVGDPLQVVLVLGLGLPERARRRHLGDDRPGHRPEAFDVGDRVLGDPLLLVAGGVDRRAVAHADVVALAVAGGRVVHLEEELEQRPEAHARRSKITSIASAWVPWLR
jgi:GGDEF domain-containing protein